MWLKSHHSTIGGGVKFHSLLEADKKCTTSTWKYTEQKKFSNFDLNIVNFHWIIFKALQFHLSTFLHA